MRAVSRSPSDPVTPSPARAPESRWLRRVCLLPAGGSLPGGEGLDGARLVRLARGHSLAARAGARIAGAPDGSPPAAAELVADWRRALGEQAMIDSALADLGERFSRVGLALVALKGADLRHRLYGPGERPSNDLDLLVPDGRVSEASAILEGAGYRPCHPREALVRRHWFATTFRHTRWERLQIDLHWGLAAPGRARWNLDQVLRRSEPMEGRPGCRVMGELDLAVYLALHAVAFHGAIGRWVWWLDLKLLAERSGRGAADVGAHASTVGGRTCWEAAGLRVESLFGRGSPAGRAGPRARLIEALARWGDSVGGPGLRRMVAALAVDSPAALLRAAAATARRELAGLRG